MRHALTAMLLTLPALASAHPGHTVVPHTHNGWYVGGGLVIAVAIAAALWFVRRVTQRSMTAEPQRARR